MGPLVKLAGAIGAAFVGYEGILWWRKQHATTPLVSGHGYTVVMSYSGPGAGGPIPGADLQNALDTGPAGVGVIRVASCSTDPTKKTITYLMGVMQNFNASSAALAPPTMPAAYGRVTLDSVHDTGAVPIGSVAVS